MPPSIPFRRLYSFLIVLLGLYGLWYILYEYLIHPWGKADLFVINMTVVASKWILEILGFTVFTGEDRLIGIDGTGGLWIGDNCNGIALFALYSIFIIAYKGAWLRKLRWILLGILLIEFLNILRVVILAILDTFSRAWTEFNHTYTFTLLIYAAIFALWMKWADGTGSFSDEKAT